MISSYRQASRCSKRVWLALLVFTSAISTVLVSPVSSASEQFCSLLQVECLDGCAADADSCVAQCNEVSLGCWQHFSVTEGPAQEWCDGGSVPDVFERQTFQRWLVEMPEKPRPKPIKVGVGR